MIRVVIDTNLGVVIAIGDDDDKILLFDDEDAGGPATTIDRPKDLRMTDIEALTSFLLAWLKAYDSKVVVESVVVEALLGGRDVPPSRCD